jgi:hypothetical protein
MAEAGLSARSILEAMLPRALAPGGPGDLVALDGDPLADLGALGRVALAVRGGRPAT